MARFEAVSRTTRESCLALARATLGRRLKARIAGAALVCIMAAGFILWEGQARPLTLVILAAALALLAFFLRTPGRMARRMLEAVPDRSLETRLRFEEDGILTGNAVESGRIGYDAVACLWHTPRYFLFYLKDDAAFAVARRDFTRGRPEDFPAFIREKSGAPVCRG